MDSNNLYTAGFSGGSRIASAIAFSNSSIDGMIGCSAGLIQSFGIEPEKGMELDYVGMVGNQDMNYLEMLSLGERLDQLDIENTIFVYEGGHSWPHDTLIVEAANWLRLRAMQENRL